MPDLRTFIGAVFVGDPAKVGLEIHLLNPVVLKQFNQPAVHEGD
jgi:hypothetical protein